MADFTTVDGIQFCFDPGEVTAVADRDANTGEAVTTVYGLTAEALQVREGVEPLLARLGIAGKFAKLTRLDGSPVWLNCAAVKVIRAVRPDDYEITAQTVVLMSTFTEAVKETLAQVKEIVNARGGKL